MLRKYTHIHLLTATLLLALLSACSKPKTQVQTGKSETRSIYSRVTESGIVQPTVDVPISPDVPGEVVYIAVLEGQKVKKGDLLVTIQPDDYKALLEQADASLNRSQAAYLQAKASAAQSQANVLQDSVSLSRTQQLFNDNVVSKVDLENAQLSFKVSKSQLEAANYNVRSSYYQVKSSEASRKQARQNLDRTNIYASMDGTITKLNIELGQRVVGTNQMAGTEILKIADLSRMEVIVEINENDIVNVGLGDSTKVEVDAFPGKDFYGKVTEIAYSATVSAAASTDQVTNFEVKVQITPASYQGLKGAENGSSPFRPGMTSLVEIYTQQVDGVVAVPIQAVTLRKPAGESEEKPEESQEGAEGDEIDQDASEVVFVYESGKVKQIFVETGISDDSYIEIKKGIDSGQEIITGNYNTLSKVLKNGMEVEKGSGKKKWDKGDR